MANQVHLVSGALLVLEGFLVLQAYKVWGNQV